jgi:Rap1a immunity proteins
MRPPSDNWRQVVAMKVVALALIAASSTAAFGSSNPPTMLDLAQLCGSSNPMEGMGCNLHIAGFGLGAYQALQTLGTSYCPPDNLSVPQARLVIEKYFRDHPERLNLPAIAVAANALTQAFPCRK